MCVAWQDDNRFATCGLKHIKFWTLEGRNLKYTKGKLSELGNVGVASIVFFQNFWVTGLVTGKLACWKATGEYYGSQHIAHENDTPVNVLLGDKESQFLYSGNPY